MRSRERIGGTVVIRRESQQEETAKLLQAGSGWFCAAASWSAAVLRRFRTVTRALARPAKRQKTGALHDAAAPFDALCNGDSRLAFRFAAGRLRSLDRALFHFINGTLSNPVFDVVMPLVSGPPHLELLLAVAGLVFAWLGGNRHGSV